MPRKESAPRCDLVIALRVICLSAVTNVATRHQSRGFTIVPTQLRLLVRHCPLKVESDVSPVRRCQLALCAVALYAIADAVVCCVRPTNLRREPTGDSRRWRIRHLAVCEPFRVEVTGCEGRWRIRYADLSGQLAAEGHLGADREIHVPQNQQVELVLNSEDYVYTFALPAYDVKEIAVPDLEFAVYLHPSAAGRFEFHGDELCGEPHSGLDGHLCVEPQDRFFQWYEEMSAQAAD